MVCYDHCQYQYNGRTIKITRWKHAQLNHKTQLALQACTKAMLPVKEQDRHVIYHIWANKFLHNRWWCNRHQLTLCAQDTTCSCSRLLLHPHRYRPSMRDGLINCKPLAGVWWLTGRWKRYVFRIQITACLYLPKA